MHSSRKDFTKFFAFLLIASFGVQDIAWAAPEISGFITSAATLKPAQLFVPADAAKVIETYQGREPRLLVHIQDAHANLGAQQNIAKTLDELIRRYKVQTIFVEGGTRDDSLSFLRPLAAKAVRERVAKKYLRMGELSGSEYLNLSTDEPMRLLGVEDGPLYDRNLRAYADVARDRERVLAFAEEIGKRVERLKRQLYPSYLLALDDFLRGFNKDDKKFAEYYTRLTDAAAQYGVNPLGYPSLMALKDLKMREEAIDFKKANEEQIERAKHPGLPAQDFPELQKYGEYLEVFSKFDLPRLIDEGKALEDEIFRRSLTGADSVYLYKISERLNNLKTLFSLQAARSDFEKYLAYQKDRRFHTLAMCAFINRKLMDAGDDADVISYIPDLEENKKNVEAFYLLTQQRDEVMVQKTLERMSAENIRAAALVTGGYHTQNLKRLLRERGVSYAVVSPVVSNETNVKRYEKILLSQLGKESPARPVQTTTLSGDRRSLPALMAIERPGFEVRLARIRGDLTGAASVHGARLAGHPKESLQVFRQRLPKDSELFVPSTAFITGLLTGLSVSYLVTSTPVEQRSTTNLWINNGFSSFVSLIPIPIKIKDYPAQKASYAFGAAIGFFVQGFFGEYGYAEFSLLYAVVNGLIAINYALFASRDMMIKHVLNRLNGNSVDPEEKNDKITGARLSSDEMLTPLFDPRRDRANEEVQRFLEDRWYAVSPLEIEGITHGRTDTEAGDALRQIAEKGLIRSAAGLESSTLEFALALGKSAVEGHDTLYKEPRSFKKGETLRGTLSAVWVDDKAEPSQAALSMVTSKGKNLIVVLSFNLPAGGIRLGLGPVPVRKQPAWNTLNLKWLWSRYTLIGFVVLVAVLAIGLRIRSMGSSEAASYSLERTVQVTEKFHKTGFFNTAKQELLQPLDEPLFIDQEAMARIYFKHPYPGQKIVLNLEYKGLGNSVIVISDISGDQPVEVRLNEHLRDWVDRFFDTKIEKLPPIDEIEFRVIDYENPKLEVEKIEIYKKNPDSSGARLAEQPVASGAWGALAATMRWFTIRDVMSGRNGYTGNVTVVYGDGKKVFGRLERPFLGQIRVSGQTIDLTEIRSISPEHAGARLAADPTPLEDESDDFLEADGFTFDLLSSVMARPKLPPLDYYDTGTLDTDEYAGLIGRSLSGFLSHIDWLDQAPFTEEYSIPKLREPKRFSALNWESAIGLERGQTQRIINTNPRWSHLDPVRLVQEWWTHLGIGKEGLKEALIRWPSLASLAAEKNLKPKLELLDRLNVPGDMRLVFLVRFAWSNVRVLEMIVGFAGQRGIVLEARTLYRAYRRLEKLVRRETDSGRIQWVKIVSDNPALLSSMMEPIADLIFSPDRMPRFKKKAAQILKEDRLWEGRPAVGARLTKSPDTGRKLFTAAFILAGLIGLAAYKAATYLNDSFLADQEGISIQPAPGDSRPANRALLELPKSHAPPAVLDKENRPKPRSWSNPGFRLRPVAGSMYGSSIGPKSAWIWPALEGKKRIILLFPKELAGQRAEASLITLGDRGRTVDVRGFNATISRTGRVAFSFPSDFNADWLELTVPPPSGRDPRARRHYFNLRRNNPGVFRVRRIISQAVPIPLGARLAAAAPGEPESPEVKSYLNRLAQSRNERMVQVLTGISNHPRHSKFFTLPDLIKDDGIILKKIVKNRKNTQDPPKDIDGYRVRMSTLTPIVDLAVEMGYIKKLGRWNGPATIYALTPKVESELGLWPKNPPYRTLEAYAAAEEGIGDSLTMGPDPDELRAIHAREAREEDESRYDGPYSLRRSARRPSLDFYDTRDFFATRQGEAREIHDGYEEFFWDNVVLSWLKFLDFVEVLVPHREGPSSVFLVPHALDPRAEYRPHPLRWPVSPIPALLDRFEEKIRNLSIRAASRVMKISKSTLSGYFRRYPEDLRRYRIAKGAGKGKRQVRHSGARLAIGQDDIRQKVLEYRQRYTEETRNVRDLIRQSETGEADKTRLAVEIQDAQAMQFKTIEEFIHFIYNTAGRSLPLGFSMDGFIDSSEGTLDYLTDPHSEPVVSYYLFKQSLRNPHFYKHSLGDQLVRTLIWLHHLDVSDPDLSELRTADPGITSTYGRKSALSTPDFELAGFTFGRVVPHDHGNRVVGAWLVVRGNVKETYYKKSDGPTDGTVVLEKTGEHEFHEGDIGIVQPSDIHEVEGGAFILQVYLKTTERGDVESYPDAGGDGVRKVVRIPTVFTDAGARLVGENAPSDRLRAVADHFARVGVSATDTMVLWLATVLENRGHSDISYVWTARLWGQMLGNGLSIDYSLAGNDESSKEVIRHLLAGTAGAGVSAVNRIKQDFLDAVNAARAVMKFDFNTEPGRAADLIAHDIVDHFQSDQSVLSDSDVRWRLAGGDKRLKEYLSLAYREVLPSLNGSYLNFPKELSGLLLDTVLARVWVEWTEGGNKRSIPHLKYILGGVKDRAKRLPHDRWSDHPYHTAADAIVQKLASYIPPIGKTGSEVWVHYYTSDSPVLQRASGNVSRVSWPDDLEFKLDGLGHSVSFFLRTAARPDGVVIWEVLPINNDDSKDERVREVPQQPPAAKSRVASMGSVGSGARLAKEKIVYVRTPQKVLKAVEARIARGVGDAASMPVVMVDKFGNPIGTLSQGRAHGRSLRIFDYRWDRVKQLSRAFLNGFDKFKTPAGISDVHVVGMAPYIPELGSDQFILNKVEYPNSLVEVYAKLGLPFFWVLDREKAKFMPQVRGNRQTPFPNEDLEFAGIPMPVRRFDSRWVQAAYSIVSVLFSKLGIKNPFERAISNQEYWKYSALSVLRVANAAAQKIREQASRGGGGYTNLDVADLMSHVAAAYLKTVATLHVEQPDGSYRVLKDKTGYESLLYAAHALDQALAIILEALQEVGGAAVIVPDHGGMDQANTPGHTGTDVPLFVVDFGDPRLEKIKIGRQKVEDGEIRLNKENGYQRDAAVTQLDLAGIPKPEEMTGESLLPQDYSYRRPNKFVLQVTLDGYSSLGDPTDPYNLVQVATDQGLTPTLKWLHDNFQLVRVPTSGKDAGLRGGAEDDYRQQGIEVLERSAVVEKFKNLQNQSKKVEFTEIYYSFEAGLPKEERAVHEADSYGEAFRELERSPFLNDRLFVIDESDPQKIQITYFDKKQIGSTEFNLAVFGTGRTIAQDVTRLDAAIRSGEYFESAGFQNSLAAIKKNGRAYFLGILQESVQGIHSSLRHLYYEVQHLKEQGIDAFTFFLGLDGRDEDKFDSRIRLKQFIDAMKYLGIKNYVIHTYPRDWQDRADNDETTTKPLLNLLFTGHPSGDSRQAISEYKKQLGARLAAETHFTLVNTPAAGFEWAGDEPKNVRYGRIARDGAQFAFLREDLDRGIVWTMPIGSSGVSANYYAALLEYFHERVHQDPAQNPAEAGRLVEWMDVGRENLTVFLRGDLEDYEPDPDHAYRLKRPFATERLRGDRYLLGEDQLFQLRFGLEGQPLRTVVTKKLYRNSKGTLITSYLVLPERISFHMGTGLINTQVLGQVQKLGLVAAASNRDPNRVRSAVRQGADVYLLDAGHLKNYQRHADLRPKGTAAEFIFGPRPPDIIVEGFDGHVTDDTHGNVSVSELMRLTLMGQAAKNGIPVIYQGGSDAFVKDGFINPFLLDILNIPFAAAHRGQTENQCFSCNGTTTVSLLAPLGNISGDIDSIEIDILYIRRNVDFPSVKFGGVTDVPAEPLEHHTYKDVLAYIDRLKKSVPRELASKVTFNFKEVDDIPRFMTKQTTGPNNLYHKVVANVKVKKTDGSFLRADEFKRLIQKAANLAVVSVPDFIEFEGEGPAEKAVDLNETGVNALTKYIIDELKSATPAITPVVVADYPNGEGFAIGALTFQKHNVVPANLAVILLKLGLVPDAKEAVRRAMEIMGMDVLKARLEKGRYADLSLRSEGRGARLSEDRTLESWTLPFTRQVELWLERGGKPRPIRRILVNEDDEFLRSDVVDFVRMILGAGPEIEVAATSEEAWADWQKGSYDLLLTDRNTKSRMTGTQLIAKIREKEQETGFSSDESAILALISGDMISDVRDYMEEEGMDASTFGDNFFFIPKPYAFSDLRGFLEAVRGGARLSVRQNLAALAAAAALSVHPAPGLGQEGSGSGKAQTPGVEFSKNVPTSVRSFGPGFFTNASGGGREAVFIISPPLVLNTNHQLEMYLSPDWIRKKLDVIVYETKETISDGKKIETEESVTYPGIEVIAAFRSGKMTAPITRMIPKPTKVRVFLPEDPNDKRRPKKALSYRSFLVAEKAGARLADEDTQLKLFHEVDWQDAFKAVSLTAEERKRLTPVFGGVETYLDSYGDWRQRHREAAVLALVRHPEATSNLFHYNQSYISFSPPTWRGYRQRSAFARFLASKGFRFDRYLSSDLERAWEGVRKAAAKAGKAVEFLKRFREASILWMPNVPRRQIEDLNNELFERFMDDPFNFEVPGWSGKRVRFYLEKFLEDASREEGKNLLVGLHGLTLVLAVMAALDIPSTKYRETYKMLGETPNLGLLFLSYDPARKKWELLTKVDDSYLPENLRGKTTSGFFKALEGIFYLARFFKRLFMDRWLLDRQSIFPDFFPIGTPLIDYSEEQLKVIVKDQQRELRARMGARLTGPDGLREEPAETRLRLDSPVEQFQPVVPENAQRVLSGLESMDELTRYRSGLSVAQNFFNDRVNAIISIARLLGVLKDEMTLEGQKQANYPMIAEIERMLENIFGYITEYHAQSGDFVSYRGADPLEELKIARKYLDQIMTSSRPLFEHLEKKEFLSLARGYSLGEQSLDQWFKKSVRGSRDEIRIFDGRLRRAMLLYHIREARGELETALRMVRQDLKDEEIGKAVGQIERWLEPIDLSDHESIESALFGFRFLNGAIYRIPVNRHRAELWTQPLTPITRFHLWFLQSIVVLSLIRGYGFSSDLLNWREIEALQSTFRIAGHIPPVNGDLDALMHAALLFNDYESLLSALAEKPLKPMPGRIRNLEESLPYLFTRFYYWDTAHRLGTLGQSIATARDRLHLPVPGTRPVIEFSDGKRISENEAERFLFETENLHEIPVIDARLEGRRLTLHTGISYPSEGARLSGEFISEVDPDAETPLASAVVYGERVMGRKWYERLMALTFDGRSGTGSAFASWLADVVNKHRKPVILDASMGTGAGSKAILDRFGKAGVVIGTLYGVDVKLPKEELNYLAYGARFLKRYVGRGIEHFRPFRLLWNKNERTFGKVSDIPGIQGHADLAVLMNAVHLIKEEERTGLFRQYFDSIKPGGLLIIGSSGVDHPDRRTDQFLLDSLFERVRLKMLEVLKDPEHAAYRAQVLEAAAAEPAVQQRAAFIRKASVETVERSLTEAGFGPVAVRTDTAELEADDFRDFLIEVPVLVEMYFSELFIKQDGRELISADRRQRILREAYRRVFDGTPDKKLTIWWTTFEAWKPETAGARLTAETPIELAAPTAASIKIDASQRRFSWWKAAALVLPVGLGASLAYRLWLLSRRPISLSVASAGDLGDIRRIQKNSGADPSLWLDEPTVKALLKTRQVIIAKVRENGRWVKVGAVFTHSSTDPLSYEQVKTASPLSSPGDFLYDFWIITDHALSKASRASGVAPADELIRASVLRAKLFHKKAAVAYSRAGGALDDIHREFGQGQSRADFYERLGSDSSLKALLLLRYILKTGPPKDTRPAAGDVGPFLEWIEQRHPEIKALLPLKDLRDPFSSSLKNVHEQLDTVRLLGLLLRQFVDESGRFPIDPTLGWRLHTRLGAFLDRIRLDSRPGDVEALGSNVQMSYENIPDIDAEISRVAEKIIGESLTLVGEQLKGKLQGPGARLSAAAYLSEELKPYGWHDLRIVEPSGFSITVALNVAGEIRGLQSDKNKVVNLVLMTGKTPKEFLHLLADSPDIDWQRVRVFQLDEYAGLMRVDDPSFAHYLDEHFISRLPANNRIPERNIHLIADSMRFIPKPGLVRSLLMKITHAYEDYLAQPFLDRYMEQLKNYGGADIVMLGMGPDGHLAFNMPGSSFQSRIRTTKLSKETRKANSDDYPGIHKNPYAYTMGLADIFEGRSRIFFLVKGTAKGEILKKTVLGPITEDIPASGLRRLPEGRVTAIMDYGAASELVNTMISGGPDTERAHEMNGTTVAANLLSPAVDSMARTRFNTHGGTAQIPVFFSDPQMNVDRLLVGLVDPSEIETWPPEIWSETLGGKLMTHLTGRMREEELNPMSNRYNNASYRVSWGPDGIRVRLLTKEDSQQGARGSKGARLADVPLNFAFKLGSGRQGAAGWEYIDIDMNHISTATNLQTLLEVAELGNITDTFSGPRVITKNDAGTSVVLGMAVWDTRTRSYYFIDFGNGSIDYARFFKEFKIPYEGRVMDDNVRRLKSGTGIEGDTLRLRYSFPKRLNDSSNGDLRPILIKKNVRWKAVVAVLSPGMGVTVTKRDGERIQGKVHHKAGSTVYLFDYQKETVKPVFENEAVSVLIPSRTLLLIKDGRGLPHESQVRPQGVDDPAAGLHGARLAGSPSLLPEKLAGESDAQAFRRLWVEGSPLLERRVRGLVFAKEPNAQEVVVNLRLDDGQTPQVTIQSLADGTVSNLVIFPIKALQGAEAKEFMRRILVWLRDSGFKKVRTILQRKYFFEDLLDPRTPDGLVSQRFGHYPSRDNEEADGLAFIEIDLAVPALDVPTDERFEKMRWTLPSIDSTAEIQARLKTVEDLLRDIILSRGVPLERAEQGRRAKVADRGGFKDGVLLEGEEKNGAFVPEPYARLIRDGSIVFDQARGKKTGAKWHNADRSVGTGGLSEYQRALVAKLWEEFAELQAAVYQNMPDEKWIEEYADLADAIEYTRRAFSGARLADDAAEIRFRIDDNAYRIHADYRVNVSVLASKARILVRVYRDDGKGEKWVFNRRFRIHVPERHSPKRVAENVRRLVASEPKGFRPAVLRAVKLQIREREARRSLDYNQDPIRALDQAAKDIVGHFNASGRPGPDILRQLSEGEEGLKKFLGSAYAENVSEAEGVYLNFPKKTQGIVLDILAKKIEVTWKNGSSDALRPVLTFRPAGKSRSQEPAFLWRNHGFYKLTDEIVKTLVSYESVDPALGRKVRVVYYTPHTRAQQEIVGVISSRVNHKDKFKTHRILRFTVRSGDSVRYLYLRTEGRPTGAVIDSVTPVSKGGIRLKNEPTLSGTAVMAVGASGARLADSTMNRGFEEIRETIMKLAETDPSRFWSIAEIIARGDLPYAHAYVNKVLRSLRSGGVENRKHGIVEFRYRKPGVELREGPFFRGDTLSAIEPEASRRQALLSGGDMDPVQESLETELKSVYEWLRRQGHPVSARDTLRLFVKKRGKNPLLSTAERIEKGFRRLETEGFPIKRSGSKWLVEGLARTRTYSTRPDDWPDEYRDEWRSLVGNESRQAAAKRLIILEKVHAIDWIHHFSAGYAGIVRTRISRWLSDAELSDEDRTDQLLEDFGHKLGLEPVYLRTGEYRSVREEGLYERVRSLTRRERIAAFRKEAGISQLAIAALIGLSVETFRDLENGVTPDLSNPMNWPAMAEVLGVDPLWVTDDSPPGKLPLILRKVETGRDVLTLRLAAGLTQKKAVASAGISSEDLRLIENDEAAPDARFHVAIAKMASRPVRELFPKTAGLPAQPYEKKRTQLGKFSPKSEAGWHYVLALVVTTPELLSLAQKDGFRVPDYMRVYRTAASSDPVSGSSIRRTLSALVERGFLVQKVVERTDIRYRLAVSDDFVRLGREWAAQTQTEQTMKLFRIIRRYAGHFLKDYLNEEKVYRKKYHSFSFELESVSRNLRALEKTIDKEIYQSLFAPAMKDILRASELASQSADVVYRNKDFFEDTLPHSLVSLLAIPSLVTGARLAHGFQDQLERLERFVKTGHEDGRITELFASTETFLSKAATHPTIDVGLSTEAVTGVFGGGAQGGTSAGTREPLGSSRVDLQACKLEYSIVSPK